ncbi:MAG: NAD(P)/FAD-dependent oxidoreductase [Pseudomonadota bacterium]
MRTAEVIVVGAGPVGTVAALALANRGIDVVVCEARPTCAQDLRASTFHPPTLRMLDELGVADEIIKLGLKAPKYHFRERASGDFIEFDLEELNGELRFPYRVQCEQHVMAGLLADKLSAHGNADVLFNSRVNSFEQDSQGVTVAVETAYDIQKIRARYVIAADGGNSIMRKWLGVEFEGFTYPEKFLCVSTKTELSDYIDNLVHVNYVADPEEWLVLLRVPSVWRVLLPASESQSDEDLLSDASCDRVFDGLIGKTQVQTEHRTIYRVHQRVARRFNHHRVFLAGDAAHLNNPLGGFGMNSGIHDAWNLQQKIAHCLQHGHDESLFDVFDRQRRTVTHSFIQAQTKHNKELLEHGAAEGHSRRFAEMRATQADDARRREFLLRQSMVQSLADAAAIQ